MIYGNDSADGLMKGGSAPAEKGATDRMTEIGNALRAIYSVRESIYTHIAGFFYGSFSLEEFDEGIQSLIDYIELLGESGKTLIPSAGRYCDIVEHIAPEDLDRLEFEYNRLFVGPGRLIAPPYESVYRTADHLVMGETALEARKAYREIGLDARNAGREPEDHIAIELEYLTELQKKCLASLEMADNGEVARIVRLELDFLENHLMCWVFEFCQRIIEGTRLELFGALAEVLSHLVIKDAEILKELEAVANQDREATARPSQSR